MSTKQNPYEMPLEETVARTIHEIRQIMADMPVNEIAVDALEAGMIRRIPNRLRADGGLRDCAEADLDTLFGILGRELDRETRGWHEEFDGRNDPEIGAVGSVRVVRTLTERGETIDGIGRRLRSNRQLHDLCTARLDAERMVFRRMAG
jgi:hypothetical protein